MSAVFGSRAVLFMFLYDVIGTHQYSTSPEHSISTCLLDIVYGVILVISLDLLCSLLLHIVNWIGQIWKSATKYSLAAAVR